MSVLEVSVAGYTADKTGNMHRIKTKRWQNEIEATNVKLTVVINRTHLYSLAAMIASMASR